MAMGAKSDQVKGKAKELVGSTVGDEDLEAEGTADRRAGEMKEKVGKVEDKVEGVID
ncbi:MAG: CsbD family protein, partial [Actinobacteria bacterium]|nr:CsbD family protein [Actinomycetota bacterium]